MNHEEIGARLERITKIKPFINRYKWERKKTSIRKR